MDGTAAAGTGTTYARGDHVHPSDTSRAPLASPTFTGTVTIPAGAAISGYAALAGAAFTGAVTAPTPVAADNSTNAATTAFVAIAITNAAVPAPSSTTPAMDGTAAAGTGTTYARADHVHPHDTSRAPLASPTFTGTPQAPTPASTDNSTNLATTAFVKTAVGAGGGGVGALVAINVYSSSQTITIPVGATQAYVQMWGATGGSGGMTGSGASGGSGAGGYLEKYLTGLTAGNTLIYTQGAAGTAGTSTPGAGGNGGVTTLASGSQTISTLTCNGSNGSGAAASSTFSAGTPGGTSSGGDINLTGANGTHPTNVGGLSAAGAPPGGVTFFSRGAAGLNGVAGAGNAGSPGGLKITWYA